MMESEFDKYAADYEILHRQSISFSGCDTGYFADYKIARAAKLFRKHCNEGDRLLDFGCGTGTSIPYFNKYMPAITPVCADVSRQSLDAARLRYASMATYLPIEGGRLALESGSIGMCFTSCVFHHIAPGDHEQWLAELRRVTSPGGVLLIFEHNPLNPLTRYAVDNCAFDRDAILIKARSFEMQLQATGWTCEQTRYHVFFPGFLKRLRPVEKLLGWLPIGGQYSILAVRT